jgi:hypothetical protein
MLYVQHFPFHMDAGDERLELLDCNAAVTTPTFGSAITSDDIDSMWAAEMARRDAEAAGRDDGTDPRPPAGGALRAEAAYWEDVAADLSDPDVITALDLANVQPQRLELATEAERTACLSGLSAVLLRRLAA